MLRTSYLNSVLIWAMLLLGTANAVPQVTVPLDSIPITSHALNRTDKRACPAAITAIFQQEAPYLKEWIEYHRIIGVEHFYLYNNRSTDHYLEVLLPYIKAGVVELFDYPYPTFPAGVQTYVYNHALDIARNYNPLLAIIDCDEFICIGPYRSLDEAAKNYPYGGITAHWQMFGTSGVHHIEDGELLTEKLLLKAPPHWGGNRQVKSIVRPQYVQRIHDPHTATYKPGYFAVLPNRAKFSHTPPPGDLPIYPINIHHYWFRTEEFFEEVKRPRRQKWDGGWMSDEWCEQLKDTCHQVYDDSMLRFADELRRRVYN